MKLLSHIVFVVFVVVVGGYIYPSYADVTKTTQLPTGLMKIYYDALDNNADLAAARAESQVKKESVPQARSGLLPQLNAGATYGNMQTALDEPASTIKRNNRIYEISLSQPLFRIDRWFKLQAAEATTEQANLEFAVVQQHLILKTAQYYFGVLQNQDNLAATKAEEAAYKRQRDQAHARFNLGLADKTDLLQAQAAYDMSKSNRISAQRMVADAYQALMTLTDHDYQNLKGIHHNLPIKTPIPNEAKTWVDKAVAQNLNLRANLYGLVAAEKNLKQSKAGHVPTVDIVATYKKGDNDAFSGFSNSAKSATHYTADVEQRMIGIQLQVPIYSGGYTSSKVREARANLIMVEQQKESLRRQVVQNTRNLYRAVNTDIERIEALRQTIISSQSAIEATEIGYQVGTRNIVDVLDAQRQLFDAVRSYNDARYSYIIDTLSLKEAVGILSPDDLQRLETYLKADYNPDRDFLPPNLIKRTQ